MWSVERDPRLRELLALAVTSCKATAEMPNLPIHCTMFASFSSVSTQMLIVAIEPTISTPAARSLRSLAAVDMPLLQALLAGGVAMAGPICLICSITTEHLCFRS